MWNVEFSGPRFGRIGSNRQHPPPQCRQAMLHFEIDTLIVPVPITPIFVCHVHHLFPAPSRCRRDSRNCQQQQSTCRWHSGRVRQSAIRPNAPPQSRRHIDVAGTDSHHIRFQQRRAVFGYATTACAARIVQRTRLRQRLRSGSIHVEFEENIGIQIVEQDIKRRTTRYVGKTPTNGFVQAKTQTMRLGNSVAVLNTAMRWAMAATSPNSSAPVPPRTMGSLPSTRQLRQFSDIVHCRQWHVN